MQTFRKLPITIPKAKTNKKRITFGSIKTDGSKSMFMIPKNPFEKYLYYINILAHFSQ